MDTSPKSGLVYLSMKYPAVSVLPVKSVVDEKSSATEPILVKLVNTRGSFAISVQLVADVDSSNPIPMYSHNLSNITSRKF
ncbi:hypothetical protein N7504_007250 [Penicillium tannophilum]|nr:hypothetical protein N7504_007250 [Penicillium tannophilum]